MLAIYKRELKSYFRSFIGFLFIAVTLFFLGLYFSVYNLMNGYPYFAYVVSSVTFLFMLTVPILTMRILAEEKRSKTDQLILTAPVSVGGIVMGKFLALLTIFAIPVAIICFYPLIMAQYGSVPMGEAYLSILAYFLFGMTAIAIGLFLSSVTESQVIAAVLTFLVLFLGYMMDSICSIISSTGNLLTKLLRCFDLYTPFSNLLNGTLDVSSIVYYVSVTALVLFLTVQSIQKRRYSMSVKNLSFSAYSTGMIAVAVALVVVVNIIMGEMPSSWTAIDMTSQKLYSLTDQTVDYVKNMQDDVTIYVLVNQDNQDTTLGQTLQRYDDLSDHITVEYVDPTVNPMFYTQYTTGNISTNSLIVVSDKRSKVIDYNDVYESSYDFDYSTYSYNTTTTGYDGEGQITSALDYVLNDDMPKVYMTTGHNELSLSNTFTSALNKENVDYETVNLMDLDAIPDDAACLFINGATSDFSSDDKDKVIDYLDNGGKVILVTGYTDDPQTDEHAVRAAFPDGIHHRGVLLEVAIMSSGDLQSGVLLLQPFRRHVRHAGLSAQQIEGSPALGHLFHQPRSKFDAGGFFLQGRSQHSRSLCHADAVRQYQIRAVDRLHGRRIFPADLHDLRIRGHYIVAPRFLQQCRSAGHGFRHGQIIKTNA